MALARAGDGKETAVVKAPPKVFSLTGILWTEKGGVASINQLILREGESLEGYRVTRIEKNKVVLKKEDEEIVLNLYQSPVAVTQHPVNPSPRKEKF